MLTCVPSGVSWPQALETTARDVGAEEGASHGLKTAEPASPSEALLAPALDDDAEEQLEQSEPAGVTGVLVAVF